MKHDKIDLFSKNRLNERYFVVRPYSRYFMIKYRSLLSFGLLNVTKKMIFFKKV